MLPKGFCYLEEIDPTILQEISYAGDHNIVGRPLAGYLKDRCVISSKVAHALSGVQRDANLKGYTLKVYEAYRPLKAIEDFVFWVMNSDDQLMKEEFYKYTDKVELFKLGYIGLRSTHTRGAAVDVTLVELPVTQQPAFVKGMLLKDGTLPKKDRFPDNSIDMGTGFDCMCDLSHTLNPSISQEAKENRLLLKGLMENRGFENYHLEWWHYTYLDEPFPETYFDFDIK